MPHLDLHLLGPCRAFLDGDEVNGIQSNKIRGLLAYLAVEADAVHSRARLAALLWPDLEESRALGYLRHALTNLRQVLCEADNAPPCLLISRATLQFNRQSDYALDVDRLTAFEEAVAAGDPADVRLVAAQQAVDAYAGPFLDGFTIYACPDFEHWLLHTRARLLTLLLNALDFLVDQCEANGDFTQALAYVDRQLLLQPWHERAHQHKMRLLWRHGDRTAALRQYETCVRALADELDVAPSPATDALHAQIQHAPAVPPAASPATSDVDTTIAILPTELRAPLTSFIGRATPLADTVALVRTTRLVTLTGPGGVGKTRLALAAGQQLEPEFPDGIFAVALASLQHPDFVWSAVAGALGLSMQGQAPIHARLADFLAGKSVLLILDNFEHLLAAAPQLADLLHRAPELHVLATSRAPLQIHGEQEFPVPPLELPVGQNADQLAEAEAIRFFTDRVRLSVPRFQVTPANAQAVARACVALDGLPLALELAASQLKYMTLPELVEQLDQSAALTWPGERDAPARHATLSKTIAWSYHLLDDSAQHLMRTVGVFSGGFTFAAAQAVHAQICAPDTPDVAHGLRALVNAGLVQRVTEDAATSRFTTLETIRQYAAQLLRASGAEEAARQAHARYFLTLAQSVERDILHLGAHPPLALLDADDDNLRAALHWTLAQGAPETALQLGVALGGYWITRFRLHEGIDWLESLLALPACHASPRINARLHAYLGRLLEMQGDYPRSRKELEHALRLARATADPAEIAPASSYLGITLRTMGEYAQARALHEESHAHYRGLNDRHGIVMAVKDIGLCHMMEGDAAAAEQCFSQAIQLSAALQDRFVDAYLLGKLGDVVVRQGRRGEGQALMRRSLERYTGLTDFAEFSALTHVQYGLTLLDDGAHDAALASIHTGLRIWAAKDTFWGTTFALLACAQALATVGCPAAAWQVAAYAVNAVEQAGAALQPVQQELLDATRELVMHALDDADATTAWQSGTYMTEQDALNLALADNRP